MTALGSTFMRCRWNWKRDGRKARISQRHSLKSISDLCSKYALNSPYQRGVQRRAPCTDTHMRGKLTPLDLPVRRPPGVPPGLFCTHSGWRAEPISPCACPICRGNIVEAGCEADFRDGGRGADGAGTGGMHQQRYEKRRVGDYHLRHHRRRSQPHQQIAARNFIVTALSNRLFDKEHRSKKSPPVRTLNFCDLKCPEGRCTVPGNQDLRHSGKPKPQSRYSKKSSPPGGLNNQLKKALYSRAGTV